MKQQTGSKSGKKYVSLYCQPAYLTYAEYIMRNARLDEAQAGIKIARRNINNLRYTDETTLMAESKELQGRVMGGGYHCCQLILIISPISEKKIKI